jgi:S1-C subfamily serine protease
MKLNFLRFLLAITISFFQWTNLHAQTMIPRAELVRKTYLINVGAFQGTAFLMVKGGEEYIITVRHLFDSALKCGDRVKINLAVETTSKSYEAKYYIDKDARRDVAVLKLSEKIQVLPPLETEGQIILGGEVLFAGYPVFSKQQFGTVSKNNSLYPLVKRGIISAFFDPPGINLYLIDAHNNPGFSGSPLVTYNFETKKTILIGVVSGYIKELKSIKTPAGATLDAVMEENSGITIAYPIWVANEIVDKEILR